LATSTNHAGPPYAIFSTLIFLPFSQSQILQFSQIVLSNTVCVTHPRKTKDKLSVWSSLISAFLDSTQKTNVF